MNQTIPSKLTQYQHVEATAHQLDLSSATLQDFANF
jgi:hypothetical protein